MMISTYHTTTFVLYPCVMVSQAEKRERESSKVARSLKAEIAHPTLKMDRD